jgi:hypothetical protein
MAPPIGKSPWKIEVSSGFFIVISQASPVCRISPHGAAPEVWEGMIPVRRDAFMADSLTSMPIELFPVENRGELN